MVNKTLRFLKFWQWLKNPANSFYVGSFLRWQSLKTLVLYAKEFATSPCFILF
jgi:hypothetical protein